MLFNGEVALITGTGSGIGRQAAILFAREGCRVIATVHGRADLGKFNDEKLAIADHLMDVTVEEQWDGLIQHCMNAYGRIDILFNNAGATIRGTILETDLELWNKAMAINLTSVYLGCRKVIPLMLKQGNGAIINNASINGIKGNTGLVAYSAAKGGVVAITRALALDHAASGIRINCICPAAVADTRMTREYIASADDPDSRTAALHAAHPIGRMAKADEVAAVAVFLASSQASYLTGLVIPVDGGRSIR